MKKIFALFLVLSLICVSQISYSQANLAPDDHSVLILSPTVSGGLGSPEALAAVKGGLDNYGLAYTPVVVPSWATYTAVDFASYRAIVVGDPTCGSTGPEASAIATTNIWGSVVRSTGGKVIIIGTDPVFHYSQGGDSLVYGGMRFTLANDPGRNKTGAYLCLSCYYNSFCTSDTVHLLDGIKTLGQSFTMTGGCTIGCYNDIHKTANAPQLANITDATLGPWSCSVHEIFNTWDILNYDVFAIGRGLDSNYIAPDGEVGSPYILTRGAFVISAIHLDPILDTNIVGQNHTFTATLDSNGSPVVGRSVTFTAIGGPCMGVLGTSMTNGSGQATVTYTCGTTGTQFVTATAVVDGVVQTSNTAVKVWREDIPSPVEMSSFVSTINGRDVTLNWATTMESNNAGFDVERSVVGQQTWNKLGNVVGNGNSTQSNNYSFSDRNVATGSYSYRLKQIDFNGNFAYYNLAGEVVIGVPTKFNLSQNFPNPFNPTTKIGFQIPTDGNVALSVYDNSGKLVSTIVNGFRSAGFYTVDFNAANIASGVYFYKIQYNSNGQDMIKVMKMAVVK